MAQLRQDYSLFTERGADVVAVGPDDADAFKRFWAENEIPFVGLADPRHVVAALYAQEVNLLKLGRMPALFVIDLSGIVRYAHYSKAMNDIPRNEEVLAVLDRLSGAPA